MLTITATQNVCLQGEKPKQDTFMRGQGVASSSYHLARKLWNPRSRVAF
jgi:hypothetical protein